MFILLSVAVYYFIYKYGKKELITSWEITSFLFNFANKPKDCRFCSSYSFLLDSATSRNGICSAAGAAGHTEHADCAVAVHRCRNSARFGCWRSNCVPYQGQLHQCD